MNSKNKLATAFLLIKAAGAAPLNDSLKMFRYGKYYTMRDPRTGYYAKIYPYIGTRERYIDYLGSPSIDVGDTATGTGPLRLLKALKKHTDRTIERGRPVEWSAAVLNDRLFETLRKHKSTYGESLKSIRAPLRDSKLS